MQQQNRGGFRRRKVCYFTQNHIEHIDFKDVDLLRKFVTDRGKNLTSSCNWYICKISKKTSNSY